MRLPEHVSEWLRAGGVGVIPTDTIYGLATPALNAKAVARVYKLRRRNPKKPFIILISSLTDLKKFGIKLDPMSAEFLKKHWPNAVSIVLPCSGKRFNYLHRGTKTLAFRYPGLKWLQGLIQKTGPLISTSANWEGKPPAQTIRAAKRYFGDEVDFYVDIGKRAVRPSTLISLQRGVATVLRQGAVRIRR